MSSKKAKKEEDSLFESIPPKESFDAFPSLDIFPESDIAFLTGKTPRPMAKPEKGPSSAPVAFSEEIAALPDPSERKPASKAVTKPVDPRSSRPSHTDSQAAAQTKGKPLFKPGSQSERKPDAKPVAQAVPLSEDLKGALSTTHSVNQTDSLSQRQTSDHTPNLSSGITINHSSNQSINLSFNHSLSRISVGDRLNENQKNVLSYLLAVKPYIIKFKTIGDALDLCEASVRTILRRLSALDFLSFKKARDGAIQGISIAFNQNLCEQFIQDQSLSHTQNTSLSHSLSRKKDHFASSSPSPFESHSPSLSVSPPESQSLNEPNDLKIDRKENLSISNSEKDARLDWSDEFMRMMWPNVFEAGFRSEQIRQVFEARRKIGREPERELLALSLDRADWEFEEKGCLTNLQNGEKVRNPAGYLFTAMARWGVLRAHPEYVSREEAEAENALKEIRRKKEAAGRVEEALFKDWLEQLSPEERQDILDQSPGGPKDMWLKNFWRKNVK